MAWKDDSAFPKRLKALREAIGVSQTAFAERMGVTRATISYYENGDRIPDIQFLDKVIRETGVCYDYLMGHSAAMKGTSKSTFSKLNDDARFNLRELSFFDEGVTGINLILGHPAFQEFVKLVGLVATGRLGGAAVNYELDYAAICEYKLFAILKKIFSEAVRLGSSQPQGDGLDIEGNTLPAIKDMLYVLDIEKMMREQEEREREARLASIDMGKLIREVKNALDISQDQFFLDPFVLFRDKLYRLGGETNGDKEE